ncbi:MAG: hypothetical protein U5Q16_13235 [Gammaproteobacteria bacterium]|nr:hypothetical protein [Gammaproteobacteria bacterium]
MAENTGTEVEAPRQRQMTPPAAKRRTRKRSAMRIRDPIAVPQTLPSP